MLKGGKVIKVKLLQRGEGFQLSSNEYYGVASVLQQLCYFSFSSCFALLVDALFISVVGVPSVFVSLSLHPYCLSLVVYILILGKWEVLVHCVQGCMRWWCCGRTRLVQAQVNFNGKVQFDIQELNCALCFFLFKYY